MRRLAVVLISLLLLGTVPGVPTTAQTPPDPVAALHDVLHWRPIGPFRGGRTVAVTGVPGRPHEYYIAAVNGGVFKTVDGARTWTPIFDDQPSASVGAIAVAPSAPDTVYVGSGEGRQRPDLAVGDGVYKSTDGGAHWTHLGLRDGQQIACIVVDPHDANRLFVAVLGHPYGPNPERGVYRSTDGGVTFTRVLGPNDDAGAFDLALDPHDPNTIYASLWAARQSPWETSAGDSFERADAGTGLYKSTDGGTTWKRLAGGLPEIADGVGRIEVAVAPSNPQRVYAAVDADKHGGIYRSDDAGATWTPTNDTERVAERGDDLAEIAVDPRDPNVVYETNTTTYRSTDAGKTFAALRGAPGGDDYQNIWISPDDPRTILLGSDQGAVLTVDGGASWSSWYNQPTAQFYHVAADNRFPYRLYGGQQESGSAEVLTRGNDGAITFREWHPVGVEEYGYVAPDPLHPWLIYGGKVTRFDERTGQTQEVGPVIGWRGNPTYRFRRTAPLAFSPADPHALYLGANVVFVTRDGGEHWRIISPDLTRDIPPDTPNLGIFAQTAAAKRPHRGVIYALGLSPRDAKVIWAGTDDGLVWHTADGGAHWTRVTPPGVGPWAKISIIDASPFDSASAYVAVNRFRLDEQRPQLFRTHDGGKTWTEIDRGIEAAPTNVVRADPKRPGLLYAGTERGVWVSFDDGVSWRSLRLNLPATSVRDLIVHGDDVDIATHGRGFWILDDVAPLRQIAALGSASPTLLPPMPTWRVMRDTYTDTPLPPDEPFFPNAPAGAYLDYVLPHAAQHVSLTITDAHGTVVRRLTSDDPLTYPVDPQTLDIPAWWLAAPTRPSVATGVHRFVWDLHTARPHSNDYDATIAAIPHETPLEPEGPRVPPGMYMVTLDVDSVHTSRPLMIREDPRAAVTTAALQRQYVLSLAIVADADATFAAAQAVAKRDVVLARDLSRANSGFMQLLSTIDSADAAPTASQEQAYTTQHAAAEALLGREKDERAGDVSEPCSVIAGIRRRTCNRAAETTGPTRSDRVSIGTP